MCTETISIISAVLVEPSVTTTDSLGRDPLAFLRGVAEQLGWYVYVLRDPRDGAIFYVGKGKGDRVYQHARHARKAASETGKQLKLDTIRKIHEEGLKVGVEIVRHRIATEAGAYEVEAAVTDALVLAGVDLANLVAGHGTSRGWRPLEDIVVRYVAEPATIAPEHRVALIRISREYQHGISADQLYTKTRQWWRVNPRRRAGYAFSVFDGIVRAVYRIDSWEQAPAGEERDGIKGRWRFTGVRDEEMEARYLWKDVSSYLRAAAQNPIKYVNC